MALLTLFRYSDRRIAGENDARSHFTARLITITATITRGIHAVLSVNGSIPHGMERYQALLTAAYRRLPLYTAVNRLAFPPGYILYLTGSEKTDHFVIM